MILRFPSPRVLGLCLLLFGGTAACQKPAPDAPSPPSVDHPRPESDPYVRAWEDTLRPLLIDAYRLNDIDWEAMRTDRRVVGVIHQASKGLDSDSLYARRRAQAGEAGYLWGSYHFGLAGDPEGQADYYLSVVGDHPDEMLCLDLEDFGNDRFMDGEEALAFIARIHARTGRYPVVYCNDHTLRQISAEYGDSSLFSRCPLWYARFRADIPGFENGTWDEYALWQFSSEINCSPSGDCLYDVPGTAYDMDIDVFIGTAAELRERWPLNPSGE